MGLFLSGITAGQLTTVSTTPLHPVGSLFYRPDTLITTSAHKGWGGQVWRYIKNGEASSAFAAGNLVVRKTGATQEDVVLGSTTPVTRTVARGVAQHAIAAGSYGWVLVRGTGLYKNDATTTIDQALIPGVTTAGEWKSQATNTDEITELTQSYGFAITAGAAGSGTTYVGHFNQIAL